MNKQDILDFINEAILDEKGTAVKMESTWSDADLDSLGSMITLLTIDAEFNLLDPDNDQAIEELDLPNLKIRDLVNQCKLSITNTSTDPNTGTGT